MRNLKRAFDAKKGSAKQQFIDLIRKRFIVGVAYMGRTLKWDTIIEEKTEEPCRFMLRKSGTIDCSVHESLMIRFDSRDFREDILQLRPAEAMKLGIGKSTLHYLRQRAITAKSFKIYNPVLFRLPG